MLSSLKIIHHEHSGRLRPHEHTSYIALTFIVLTVGVILGTLSLSTAFADHPPPQAGSVGLEGTVPTPPPKTGATITSPNDQQHFSTSPITVLGTCPDGTLIQVYKNDIFAGAIPCGSNGSYSLKIDLLYGHNDLTVQVYDILNQAGPVSKPITVFYDASPLQSAGLDLLNLSGSQLLLNTNAVYRGSFPGQMLNVPVTIIGGTQPYAVNVQWGDSSNKVIPRGDNTVFNASHTYQKPGTYKITLQGSDSHQQVAFLAVAAIVNGQPSPVAGSSGGGTKKLSKLLVLWPLYAVIATTVISFWMGERREKHMLNSLNPQNTPTFGVTPRT